MAYANTRSRNLDEAAHKGSLYFEKFYVTASTPWFKGRRLDRKTIVTFNRLRSNHYSAAASLARKGIVASPGCDALDCGFDYQDFDHLLWYCPRYRVQREAM